MFSTYILLSTMVVLGLSGECHAPPRSRSKQDINSNLAHETAEFWMQSGEEELLEALRLKQNTNVAKNIIIFIGDGMGLPTVTAARVYKGQQGGNTDGNSAKLSWETFPNVALSKTYSADFMVPDSAATASSMYSGVKTTGYTMGFDNTIGYREPGSAKNATVVTTVLDWAQAAGKKTGFVTTTRMSHATPAALYAKSENRFWECDNDIIKSIEDGEVTQEEVDTYKPVDITRQLVESEAGKKIDIMLGGGRASWLPRNESDHDLRFDYESDEWNCTRWDGRNLIEEWKGNHTGGVYMDTRSELMGIDMANTDSVLGIFANTYVTWDDQVNATNEKPRLVDMAIQTVNFLKEKSGTEGFFAMIEGGRIDQAHHNGKAARALSETLAFDKAIEEVVNLVDLEDTLIIVTADHAHTMSIGGYVGRNIDITGVVKEADGSVTLATDTKTFSVLSYGNGPGFMQNNATEAGDYKAISRDVLGQEEVAEMQFLQASAAPLSSETHGGDDVGIWAAGPMSHLFHGVHEQNYIGHVMSYAACIGPHQDKDRCKGVRSGGSKVFTSGFMVALLFILISTLL